MIRKSQFIFFFLVFFLFIGLQPVSGYVWQDHFITDTSANYDGKVTAYTWNTGLTTGWLNCTNFAGHRILHYKNEKFGSGWYNWSYTDYGGSSWPFIIWADTSASDTGDSGNPTSSGTKYGCRAWPSAWFLIECFKVVGGVYTELGQNSYSIDYHYNISIFWDFTTGDIHVYEDDINLRLDLNDNAITNSGYMGISYYSPSGQSVGWDVWNYANETSPAPTPTPTPTPAPLPSEINPHVISKGKTFIYWGWNETGINYTYLDGILVNLNNGTYIYSNLIPNTKHILTLSYDGINETSSTVTTDKEYTYDIWLIPLIGLILIFGFKLSPISPFFGFLIVLINLVINLNQFNDVEKIVNILFIITGVLLFKFKFGDI